MNNNITLSVASFFILTHSFVFAKQPAITITISPSEAAALGQKIWNNECHCSVEKLTWWKKGEEFASLGIGHFIWFPAHYKGTFTQQFPLLIRFLKHHGVIVPAWLNAKHLPCPWKSETEFFNDFNSPRMKELRNLLATTTDLQAQFIVEQFQQSVTNLFKRLPKQEQAIIRQQLLRLVGNSRGLYALIDYANFKGTGINRQEIYKHQGWGIVHVLKHMKGTQPGQPALQDFAQAAKDLLTLRVKNAPPARGEAQWLKGWFNRIDTYSKV